VSCRDRAEEGLEMRALLVSGRYALANALLLAFIAALAHGGWPIWVVVGSSILIGGAVDEAAGDECEPCGDRGQFFFDANLYATLPLLMIVTYLLLDLVASGRSGGVIAAAMGAGYFYALAGATVAHELTHRVTRPLAIVSARALLAFTLNPTFETYHIHGHHRNVCTYDDPATARRGEYVLAFVARSVLQQSIAGWRLEAERLRHRGPCLWSWRNRVLGGTLCVLAVLAAAAWIAGGTGMAVFVAAAAFGRIIHEMVNYVQHYGLVRADGAPIETRHAWDSCSQMSNVLLYNLPRHADHHMFGAKPFWQLAAAAGSPKLPHGYQMMSTIALVPSWWHSVTAPLLADWDSRLASAAERSLVKERGWAADAPPPARNASGCSIEKPDLRPSERMLTDGSAS
jgi:alkane 1-monooxygenase